MPPACFRRKALECPVPDRDDVAMDDLTNYRLDEAEKRADKADARFDRIADRLEDGRVQLVAINGQLAVLADSSASLAQQVGLLREQIAALSASAATRTGVWGAVVTGLVGGLGLLGVMVAILTYLQAFPHPH
jgi:hypothetical protein